MALTGRDYWAASVRVAAGRPAAAAAAAEAQSPEVERSESRIWLGNLRLRIVPVSCRTPYRV